MLHDNMFAVNAKGEKIKRGMTVRHRQLVSRGDHFSIGKVIDIQYLPGNSPESWLVIVQRIFGGKAIWNNRRLDILERPVVVECSARNPHVIYVQSWGDRMPGWYWYRLDGIGLHDYGPYATEWQAAGQLKCYCAQFTFRK